MLRTAAYAAAEFLVLLAMFIALPTLIYVVGTR